MQGRVEGIYISPRAGELPKPVDRIYAVAGLGLKGDRYFKKIGTYSNQPNPTGRDLTLIEAEVLEPAAVNGAKSRRNVVVSGLPLGALVGERFRVGETECYGQRLCEPCVHLAGLTHDGVIKALVHTGLRADILVGGEIRVGDAVYSIDSSASSSIDERAPEGDTRRSFRVAGRAGELAVDGVEGLAQTQSLLGNERGQRRRDGH